MVILLMAGVQEQLHYGRLGSENCELLWLFALVEHHSAHHLPQLVVVHGDSVLVQLVCLGEMLAIQQALVNLWE